MDCVDDQKSRMQKEIGSFFELPPHNRPNAERRTFNVKRNRLWVEFLAAKPED
jgi:hypothetical protein